MGNVFGYIYGYFFGFRKLHPSGACEASTCPRNPKGCKVVLDLISEAGHEAESHNVTTEDGFILCLQRVQLKSTSAGKKPIVFLQHGLLDAAATWIVNGKHSLSAILVESGCDVWLGNTRGNTFSRCHVHFDADDHYEYWNWSWDEIHKYDLPAMINYVLKQTQQEQLYYVGHSQGTLIAFAAFSTNQLLASKVKKLFALAPVACISNVQGATRDMAELTKDIPVFELNKLGLTDVRIVFEFGVNSMIGDREIGGNADFFDDVGRFMSLTSVGEELLAEVISGVSGPDDDENPGNYPLSTVFNYFPAGTSSQNISHYCQMFSSKKMESYDQKTTYNLKKMEVDAVLFYGSNDYLADEKDVCETLLSKLPKCKARKLDGWNHSDFVWGGFKAQQVYTEIAEMIRAAETAS